MKVPALVLLVIITGLLAGRVKSTTLEHATSDMVADSVQSVSSSHVDVLDFSVSTFEMNCFLAKSRSEDIFSVKISTDVDKNHLNEPEIDFCLLLFKTQDGFLAKIDSIFADWHLDTNGHYIIVLTDDINTNKSNIFSAMWRKSFYNVAVLSKKDSARSQDSVELFTFYPFGKHHCNQTQSTLINTYINSTWTSQKYFPEKFQNFHKCPIKVGATAIDARFMEQNLKNGSRVYIGTDAEILYALAKALNFKLSVNYSSTIEDFGTVYENGTSAGVISQLISGDSELVAGFFLHIRRAKFMGISKTYSFFPVLVMIPLGAPFTSLENLIRPFSINVWFSVLFVVILALIVTFMINRKSSVLAGAIERKDKKNCFLNLLVIVVGGSIVNVPKRNSQRIFIMTFIITCLVMRTVYQSKMFNFFQAGDSRKVIRSLDDMEEMGYNLYVKTSLSDLINDAIKYPEKKQVKMLDGGKVNDLRKETLDPSFKGGIVTPIDSDLYLKDYKFLDEAIAIMPVVMYFRKNSHLVLMFNKLLDTFESSGLIRYWTNLYINHKHLKNMAKHGPISMNFRAMLGAFQVLSSGLIISLVIFFIELIKVRISSSFV